MRKSFVTLFALFLFVVCTTIGCDKDEPEQVVIADEVVEEDLSIEESVSTEEFVAEPAEKENDEKEDDEEETATEEEAENPYPYWWDLHDYHLDQQDLSPDSEFKNLTIQPGNQPDELYITWFSKSSSKGKVTFETDGLFADISAKATTEPSVSVPGYYRNSALISGLESNTTYSYHLKNGNSVSPVYTYQTQDLYATDFTFTIAGDPEIGLGDEDVLSGHRSIWRVVLNRMKSEIPDSSFLITTGDQVAHPSDPDHYDALLDNSVLYSTPLAPVVGNHDNGTGYFGDHFSLPNMSSIGTESGRDGDYWFVKGNTLFMVINNMCPQPTEVHEQFIAEAINANPDAKWRIVVSHYSPVTQVERYLGCREAVKLVYHYMGEVFDIDLFIGGHDHIYTRGYFIDDDGDPLEDQELEHEFDNPEDPIFIIANGATDALLRDPEEYPWAAVTVQNGVPQLSEVHVTDDSLTVTTHDADSWATVDSFTIYKD